MCSSFLDVLSENKATLAETIMARLKTSGAVHYRAMAGQVLQERVASLLDSFFMALEKNPGIFITYIKKMTDGRIAEGFFLHEIQTALQILEEKSWQLVVDNMPQSDQVGCLSRITGIIGAAKDQLAHVYLQHLERAEETVALLELRLVDMAKGTDSGPVSEEVLP